MGPDKDSPCCIDLCEHCMYVEEGDFYCEVVQDITIKEWTPLVCPCPKKRKVEK
jgi:hypothetical protein